MAEHGPDSWQLANSSSVLIHTPPSSPSVTAACLDVIAGDDPTSRSVVAITSGPCPESFVDGWYDHVGVDPADLRIIDIGAEMRSADARASSDRRPRTPARNVVRAVDDLPDALCALNDILEDPPAPVGDARPVVFVDSLTALLGRVDRSELIRFVDDVEAAVRAVGGSCCFRIEPDRHDDDTVALVAAVVDATIQVAVDADGWTWSVLDHGPDGDAPGPPLDVVFCLLADRRRRVALHRLRRADGPVSIDSLAGWVAARERNTELRVRDDAYERVYTGLHHVHLPKLEAAGIVTLDDDRTTVALSEDVARIDLYLILAAEDDLGG